MDYFNVTLHTNLHIEILGSWYLVLSRLYSQPPHAKGEKHKFEMRKILPPGTYRMICSELFYSNISHLPNLPVHDVARIFSFPITLVIMSGSISLSEKPERRKMKNSLLDSISSPRVWQASEPAMRASTLWLWVN